MDHADCDVSMTSDDGESSHDGESSQVVVAVGYKRRRADGKDADLRPMRLVKLAKEVSILTAVGKAFQCNLCKRNGKRGDLNQNTEYSFAQH